MKLPSACTFLCFFFQSMTLTGTCRFHPDFYDGKSKIQFMMLGYMHEWVEDFGHKKKSVLKRLTKEAVREHKNVLREGETGVSQALVNPLGLPTLEDLKIKRPPREGNSTVVGMHEGKPIYFNPRMYGKGGDASPVTKGVGSPPSYASSYTPSNADSEASSQDRQRYMWNPGLSREGVNFTSGSTEDFYSAERSSSLPAKSYSPPSGPPPGRPLGPPQTTEAFRSTRPDPQWGPSQTARDFYSSLGPTTPALQNPPLQQPRSQVTQNPFLRQMSSPPQLQSLGMGSYSWDSQQGSRFLYNPYPPRAPQISPGAASFYASPPPQPPQLDSQPGQEGETDPLAELTANLRRF